MTLTSKNKLFIKLLFVLISTVWTSCMPYSNRIAPPVTSLTYTDADMRHLEDIFKHNIAIANLSTVSAGANALIIDIPSIKGRFASPLRSKQKPIVFQLPIQPVILSVPGIFAKLRLNNLGFKDVKAHWDGKRKALRLRSRFYNKRRGVVGYYKIGFIRKDISLKVKDAVLDIFIIPRVESGELTFAPLEAELSFYEGKVPRIIRPIFHERIGKTIEKSRAALQPQFDTQAPRIVAMVRNLFVPEAQFVDIHISEGAATLRVKY